MPELKRAVLRDHVVFWREGVMGAACGACERMAPNLVEFEFGPWCTVDGMPGYQWYEAMYEDEPYLREEC